MTNYDLEAPDLRFRPPFPRRSEAGVLVGEPTRAALRRGAKTVADAVRTTLGPRGRNAIIAQSPRPPIITNDGVTIARSIELADEFENMGARFMFEAADRAAKVAGGGTTTAIVLAAAMLAAGDAGVAVGVNPMSLRRGIELATKAVVAHLESAARPVADRREVAAVAAIAANDPAIGELVAEAIQQTRPDGSVIVTAGRGTESTLRSIDGLTWERGYISAAFINSPSAEVVLEEPYILITDQRLHDANLMAPFFETLGQAGIKSLLITCHDVDNSVSGAFLAAMRHGDFEAAIVKAPAFARRRQEICEDLAIATGGEFIAAARGLNWAEVTPAMLGRAGRAVVRAEEFVIAEPRGDPARVAARIALLQEDAKATGGQLEADRILERAQRLNGKVAIISVGAPTETELGEVGHRVEDGVAAALAFLEGGALPGGGVSLLHAARALENLDGTGEEAVGVDVVRRALAEPVRQIAANAGVNGARVVERLRATADPNVGFDARTGEFVNLFAVGVLDPVTVVRSSLSVAASVATALLMTDAAVRFTPEPQLPNREEKPPRRLPGRIAVVTAELGPAALLRGADALADAVRTTLGPAGRPVGLERKTAAYARRPLIIDDGATVARDIELPDPVENVGAQILREAALETSETVGDGTTTATVLAQAVLRGAVRATAWGADPMLLRGQIERAAAIVDRELTRLARPIQSGDEIEWVGLVSSGDPDIASAVRRAFELVDRDDAVEVRDGPGLTTGVRAVSGMKFPYGYASHLFCTGPGLAELEQPLILVSDRQLVGTDDLVAALDRMAGDGPHRVVLVAPSFGDDVLGFLLANMKAGTLQALPIRAPAEHQRDREVLIDLAMMTGATLISPETGVTLANITRRQVGLADRVSATAGQASVVGGAGDPGAIAERCDAVAEALANTRRKIIREILRGRLMSLSGKVAIVEIGAPTAVERTAARMLAEDAVRAGQAAMAEGVLAGAASAYLHAAHALDDGADPGDSDGATILRNALEAPFRTILENAGVAPAALLPRALAEPYGHGYDVLSGSFRNLFEAGIIDPLLVVRAALRHGVSAAVSLLTTQTVIAYIPPTEPAERDIDARDYAAMLSDESPIE